MKKRLSLALVTTLLFTLIVTSAGAMTLNFAMTATEKEHHGACIYTFADYVMANTDDIEITVYPSSTLYDDSNLLEAMMRGNLEMGVAAPAMLSEFYPGVSVLGACYVFRSPEHMLNVMNGEIGQALYDKIAEETNIRILGALYKGRRCIDLTIDKKITSRADMEGILLRTPNSESWMNMGRALGATPVAMALSEVYLGLQAGTIQGQDNPLQATMLYGFGEVTKSITMTNHVIDLIWICIDEDIWQGFDDATKAVFMEAFHVAENECTEAFSGEEADLIAQFREMGLSVYDDVDTTEYAAEIRDWYFANADVIGDWDMDLYEAIQSAE